MSREPFETARRPDVAVLFAAHADPLWLDATLDELAGLAEASDVGVAARLSQRVERPAPGTYLGSGKVEELRQLVQSTHADLAIAGMDLTPAQARNLTKAVDVRVVDRSELIMDIFARRARTAQAKLQVELAQLQYALPRLRGQWAHLDRYKGGGVGTRGPGEKQLETDRRLVNRRIRDLQKRLELCERRTQLNLSGRRHARKVALAGYTNTGKSTLFNALTGADVLAANRLFATLDTRTRKWPIEHCSDVVLSDTVGFVRDLPHHLVASFHATLEEVIEADLVLHVVDASDPHAEGAIRAVQSTLATIEADRIPTVLVFNKIDRVADAMELLARRHGHADAIFVSARTGAGLDELAARVAEHFLGSTHLFELAVPLEQGRTLALLGELAEVVQQDADEHFVRVRVRVSDPRLPRLRAWARDEGVGLEPVGVNGSAHDADDARRRGA